jgi:AcrR family transcriptional regulator
MATEGTSGLSIRAIARELDVTPPAIYSYFESLDELITALIVDNFNALADALEIARDGEDGDATEKLKSVLRAYRNWAVAHPVDFQLIYGDPIPGYVAPREVTVPAVIRGFVVIVELIEALLESGYAKPAAPYVVIPPEVRAMLEMIRVRDSYKVSDNALYLGVVGWTQLHGIIMLDIFNHLQPVVGNLEQFYEGRMHEMFAAFGLKTQA